MTNQHEEPVVQSGKSWSDTQKHLVETTTKITGWGVAAAFVFAGWLMSEEELSWPEKPATCVLVVVAAAAISFLWQRGVTRAAQACRAAFAQPGSSSLKPAVSPTALVDRAPCLAWIVAGIVVFVTLLSCFDDYWDR
jgi:hypothetical protein